MLSSVRKRTTGPEFDKPYNYEVFGETHPYAPTFYRSDRATSPELRDVVVCMECLFEISIPEFRERNLTKDSPCPNCGAKSRKSHAKETEELCEAGREDHQASQGRTE